MIRSAFGRRGFSLIELLVVITILAILMAIVIPSLISSQPTRSLAAASEKFGLDVKFAMQTAASTGNEVIIGFDYDPNPDNIEDARTPDGTLVTPTYANGQFVNPGNPGAARVAKRYFIVEARKRWRGQVIVGSNTGTGPSYGSDDESKYLIPYTYVDWLNLYDAYNNGRAVNAPVEPLFPYAEGIGEPKSGDFNAFATPRYAYPQNMTDTSNTDYVSRFLGGTPVWSSGNRNEQAYKIFCVADREEILDYDQNPVTLDSNGLRLPGPEDSMKLNEQITDYVLLKEVALPDHVVFINPTHNYWVTDFENTSGGTIPSYQDMQFVQHLWVFHPNGEAAIADWGYEDLGDPSIYVHGNLMEKRETPKAHCFWMITEEVAEDIFDGDTSAGSPFNERKAQQDMNGRIFILWPLNGQYVVQDYAPNDFGKGSLEAMISGGGLPVINNDEVTKKRELGYNQNFLTGP
ncbi:MAG: type II secretion system GspH family protein [bacterium]|nr:type II secretion system GspH family protein [bacterium]